MRLHSSIMQAGATIEGRFAFDAETSIGALGTGLIERDVKVFRVGKFTDMFGRTKDWTVDDLDEAVRNFRILSDSNVLPNIPVRVDHTFSMKDVGGYIVNVRREGEFLLADLEFTDEEVHAKYRKKHLRNRSLEIGRYVTNQGQEYNPVVLGLAFVDLPAVEGLYHLSTGDTMSGQTTNPTVEPAAETEPEPTPEPTPAPDPAPTPEPAPMPDPAPSPAGDPATEPEHDPVPEAVGAHGRPYAYRVNGASVTDPVAVQSYIDALELFRKESVEGARVGFIDTLAERNIVTGPQAEKFRTIVVDMTPEMFAAFREGFGGDTVAPANIFGRHDLGDGGGDGQPQIKTTDRISVLEEVVANHRRLGHSEEQISKLGSFQELQQLRQQTQGS